MKEKLILTIYQQFNIKNIIKTIIIIIYNKKEL